MPKIPILVSYPQQISDIIIFSQENQNKRVTYTLSNYKFFQMTFKKIHLHILILFADMKKTSTLLKTWKLESILFYQRNINVWKMMVP